MNKVKIVSALFCWFNINHFLHQQQNEFEKLQLFPAYSTQIPLSNSSVLRMKINFRSRFRDNKPKREMEKKQIFM
ncbi:CLUMA_CG020327, isoform A [Clunio marinus]|uniref:CLUMA_CG020327, isoform A n=1 Tax=Clunio marinus TaxID=568069 RepID=A0A1J1J6E2_9DIPT|nr:CLUMA_CG020327, isoform A [Clunio marinus]